MQKDTLADKIVTATIVLAILALATACNSEKRFNDYSIKNPDKFKKLAAILAPCTNVKAKSDTIVTTRLDTVYSAGETVITRIKDTVFVTRTLPAQIITKTKTLAIHDTVPDSRAIEACAIKNREVENKIIEVQTKYEEKSKSAKNWMWSAIGLGVVLIVGVVLWLKGVVKL